MNSVTQPARHKLRTHFRHDNQSSLLCMTQQKIQTCVPVLQVAAAVFVFRGTVLTKRSNFAADLDVWRNANRDLYFAARAVKHLRLEMAQLQRQYPGVQWGFFCTGEALSTQAWWHARVLLLQNWGSFSICGPSSAQLYRATGLFAPKVSNLPQFIQSRLVLHRMTKCSYWSVCQRTYFRKTRQVRAFGDRRGSSNKNRMIRVYVMKILTCRTAGLCCDFSSHAILFPTCPCRNPLWGCCRLLLSTSQLHTSFRTPLLLRKHILQELVSTVFLMRLDHGSLSHVMGSKAL